MTSPIVSSLERVLLSFPGSLEIGEALICSPLGLLQWADQGWATGEQLVAGQAQPLLCSLVTSPWIDFLSVFFQESRDGRVDSWRNFQANTKGKKEKKNRTFLRPPKVKMEQRE